MLLLSSLSERPGKRLPIAIGALLLTQWRLFASPLASGYGTLSDLYSLGNIAPNLVRYSRRFVEGEVPALTTLIGAAIILIVTRRRTPDASTPVVRPARNITPSKP